MRDVSIAEPLVGEAAIEGVRDVLASGRLADGDVVRSFETEFGEYCGVDHAVGTTNGTTALHATLEAIGIEPGRGVVTTPFSFVATANAIRFAGGIPIFADIDPETFNLDPHSVEAAIREHRDMVDAILAVHLYGLPARMDHLRDIADTYDLLLVEDAAQAHGARFGGEPVGSLGDAACFSFYPTKNMTTGEGGMVTTDRADIARRVRQFIDHGRGEGGYEHATLGHNFRMTNVAAAIGREQLTRLPEFTTKRRENASRLTDRLADTPVRPPSEPAGRSHVYHQYTVRCDDRDRLRETLADRGIDTGVYYPNCIHELGAYDSLAESNLLLKTDTTAAERAADEVLSLPVHPGVTSEDVDAIGSAIGEVVHA